MTNSLATREIGRPTPGPWRIYGPQPDTLGGRHLTILAGTGKARFGVADIRIIDPNDALEASANAHLIAAAPELYEAVRLFVEEYDAGDEADGVALMLAYNNALEAAKAALAKARGAA